MGQELPTGHILRGRFRVKQVLGRGSASTLYLGHDTTLGHKAVAIKAFDPDTRSADQLKAEAERSAHLNHPALPGVVDFFEEEGRHYLIRDYLGGTRLKDFAREQISTAKALDWGLKLCSVLSYLHSRSPAVMVGVLHPDSVLVETDQLKLTNAQRTEFSAHAAPEIKDQAPDVRSDVYTLGALLHDLLTGEAPPSKRELPDSLRALLGRMVSEDPDRRPTLDEVKRTLLTIASPPTVERAPSRPPWKAVVSIVLGISLTGLGWWSVQTYLANQPAKLDLKSDPSGAIVTVDGSRLGTTPFKTELAPGSYELRLHFRGHQSYEKGLQLEPGSLTTMTAKLKPASGSLKISAQPTDSKLWLNGQLKGVPPLAMSGLQPGNYKLKVTKKGYRSFEREIEVFAGRTNHTQVTLKKIAKPRRSAPLYLPPPRSTPSYEPPPQAPRPRRASSSSPPIRIKIKSP